MISRKLKKSKIQMISIFQLVGKIFQLIKFQLKRNKKTALKGAEFLGDRS